MPAGRLKRGSHAPDGRARVEKSPPRGDCERRRHAAALRHHRAHGRAGSRPAPRSALTSPAGPSWRPFLSPPTPTSLSSSSACCCSSCCAAPVEMLLTLNFSLLLAARALKIAILTGLTLNLGGHGCASAPFQYWHRIEYLLRVDDRGTKAKTAPPVDRRWTAHDLQSAEQGSGGVRRHVETTGIRGCRASTR